MKWSTIDEVAVHNKKFNICEGTIIDKNGRAIDDPINGTGMRLKFTDYTVMNLKRDEYATTNYNFKWAHPPNMDTGGTK